MAIGRKNSLRLRGTRPINAAPANGSRISTASSGNDVEEAASLASRAPIRTPSA